MRGRPSFMDGRHSKLGLLRFSNRRLLKLRRLGQRVGAAYRTAVRTSTVNGASAVTVLRSVVKLLLRHAVTTAEHALDVKVDGGERRARYLTPCPRSSCPSVNIQRAHV